MEKKDFVTEATRLGDEVGRLDKALARFGIETCRAASAGFALPEEAEKILTAFQGARYLAREGKRLGQPPHKVQVSKLRQFLKGGNEFGSDAVEMLECLARQDFFYEVEGGSYEALLKVLRAAKKAGRPLTEAEIKSLFN